MDPVFWKIDDQALRSLHSPSPAHCRNTLGRAILTKVDDTKAAQYHQVESHNTEIRDNLQRLGNFGFGSVPLPGASAVILWPTGHRGYGVVVGLEDGRYRVTGHQPGESSPVYRRRRESGWLSRDRAEIGRGAPRLD